MIVFTLRKLTGHKASRQLSQQVQQDATGVSKDLWKLLDVYSTNAHRQNVVTGKEVLSSLIL